MPTSPRQKAEGWRSITEILEFITEPELIAWKAKVGATEANKISRLTAKTGTRVHQLIQEDWLKNGYKLKMADNSEVRSCMEAWERFKRDHKPEIISMEDTLTHDYYKLIGHQDIIIQLNDLEHVGCKMRIDVKTAGEIRPKHWLQLGGYELCAPCYNGAILRLDRNIGTYEFETNENVGYDMTHLSETFKQLVKVYDFFNNRAYGSEKEADDNRSIPENSPTNS